MQPLISLASAVTLAFFASRFTLLLVWPLPRRFALLTAHFVALVAIELGIWLLRRQIGPFEVSHFLAPMVAQMAWWIVDRWRRLAVGREAPAAA